MLQSLNQEEANIGSKTQKHHTCINGAKTLPLILMLS